MQMQPSAQVWTAMPTSSSPSPAVQLLHNMTHRYIISIVHWALLLPPSAYPLSRAAQT